MIVATSVAYSKVFLRKHDFEGIPWHAVQSLISFFEGAPVLGHSKEEAISNDIFQGEAGARVFVRNVNANQCQIICQRYRLCESKLDGARRCCDISCTNCYLGEIFVRRQVQRRVLTSELRH